MQHFKAVYKTPIIHTEFNIKLIKCLQIYRHFKSLILLQTLCFVNIKRNLFLDSEELCQRTACYKQYSKTLSWSHLSVSLYVLGARFWLRPSSCGCYRKACIQEQQCIWVWAVLSGSRTRLTYHNTSRNLLFGFVCW